MKNTLDRLILRTTTKLLSFELRVKISQSPLRQQSTVVQFYIQIFTDL